MSLDKTPVPGELINWGDYIGIVIASCYRNILGLTGEHVRNEYTLLITKDKNSLLKRGIGKLHRRDEI